MNSLDVTTALLAVAALFVVYTRLQNWLDSNIPLIFYGVLLVYTNMVETRLKPSVIYGALVLALLLRFEFMNNAIVGIMKTLEYLALAIIIYDCVATVMRW